MTVYAAGTQKARILKLLKQEPVCSSMLYGMVFDVTHRLAARIHEMRADGLPIDSRRCENGGHRHTSGMDEYVLNGPGPRISER